MKRKASLVAVAMLAACFTWAQDKKEKVPPPPPAPPAVAHAPAPPPPPPPPPKKAKASLPDDYKAFLKRNAEVKNIRWSENNTVRIQLRSGQEDIYDLNNKEEAQKLEAKYGKLPTPPPPPPKPLDPPPPPKPIEQV